MTTKLFLALGISALLMVSCTKSPEALAKDYCQCKTDKGNDSNECTEMAEAHFLQLQDEPELLQKYSAAVAECITNPAAK